MPKKLICNAEETVKGTNMYAATKKPPHLEAFYPGEIKIHALVDQISFKRFA
jgi:hypothetical protein